MRTKTYKIRPTPTDAYLANPHKGCCTFQHFNGDDFFPGTSWSEEGPLEFPAPRQSGVGYDALKYLNELNSCGRWEGVKKGYLPSTVAYCRWFWNVLEPEAGKYDFSMIDGSLERCRETGQTLAVRLMAHGAPGQPEVPEWYSKKYTMLDVKYGSYSYRCPDYDSNEFFKLWGQLIKTFAEKYDNNPLLESVDVAFIGPWGEGAGKCSHEKCVQFAELWENAFKYTPRISLIEGYQFKEGIKRGSGWRADCFGDSIGGEDLKGDSTVPLHLAWNHMYDCYPAAICRADAGDVWQTAPVYLESCSVPTLWHQMGRDLEWIVQQGWKYHATYFMPKYTLIPDEMLPMLRKFCSRLGYRFVFHQALVSYSAKEKKQLNMQIWIENVGVAPLYRKYDFALRLRQGTSEIIIIPPNIDIRKWLPGDVWLDLEFEIPGDFKAGEVELAAGIIDEDKIARINFAVEERYLDRWVPLGSFYK
jgi:hypothetical protein